MKRILLSFISTAFLVSGSLFAQDSIPPFVPSGKVSATIFTSGEANYEGDSLTNIEMSLKRAYFGYSYQPTKELTGNVIVDVAGLQEASNNVTLNKRFMYLRIANAVYKKNNSTITMGIFDLNAFKLQQATWGNRYIYRSFMDQNKFAQAADIGVMLEQKLTSDLTMDVAITNGEGFTQVQADKNFTYTGGATLIPNEKVTLRLFADYTTLSVAPLTIGSFISLKASEKFTISGEYNYKYNQKGVDNNNLGGLSTYASYSVDKKVKLFARYDKLWSNTLSGATDPWNQSKDGSAIIGGVEYTPTKGFRIAANYQNWNYVKTTLDTKSVVGIFAEIKF